MCVEGPKTFGRFPGGTTKETIMGSKSLPRSSSREDKKKVTLVFSVVYFFAQGNPPPKNGERALITGGPCYSTLFGTSDASSAKVLQQQEAVVRALPASIGPTFEPTKKVRFRQ